MYVLEEIMGDDCGSITSFKGRVCIWRRECGRVGDEKEQVRRIGVGGIYPAMVDAMR